MSHKTGMQRENTGGKEAIKGNVPERKAAEKRLKTYRLEEGMVR